VGFEMIDPPQVSSITGATLFNHPKQACACPIFINHGRWLLFILDPQLLSNLSNKKTLVFTKTMTWRIFPLGN